MLLVLTVCTVRQLPQALVLGDAVAQYHPEARFQIGLADDAASLTDVTGPHALLPVREVIDAHTLAQLSAQYTPTEFAASVKPTLIRAMVAQHPSAEQVIYLDPNTFLYAPLTPVLSQLQTASVLLTPYLTKPIADKHSPDEKYFQNIGLYSADFLAFCPSPETERLLVWWENRVLTRAQIDFCESLCLDQIWLMHASALFEGVRVMRETNWHRALWNWHERDWADERPPLWLNFKGLYDRNEGLFPYQTRLKPDRHPLLRKLLTNYNALVTRHQKTVFQTPPAFGQCPEPIIRRGWRRQLAQLLRSVARFVDQVPLPAFR